MRRIFASRGVRVASALIALGLSTAAACYLLVDSTEAQRLAAGDNPITAALHAYSLALRLSEAWVIGVLIAHGVLGAVALRRKDRSVLNGILWSLTAHAVFAVAVGMIRVPWLN